VASQAIHAEHAVTITGDLLELLQAAPEIRFPAAAPERLPVPVADAMRHARMAGRAHLAPLVIVVTEHACSRGRQMESPDTINRAWRLRAVASLRP
jgi:hypothetical protein